LTNKREKNKINKKVISNGCSNITVVILYLSHDGYEKDQYITKWTIVKRKGLEEALF